MSDEQLSSSLHDLAAMAEAGRRELNDPSVSLLIDGQSDMELKKRVHERFRNLEYSLLEIAKEFEGARVGAGWHDGSTDVPI